MVATEKKPSEDELVWAWRYEVLLRAGLDDEHASYVAFSDFDLHRALEMIEGGCAPETLVLIAQ
jgi:hypothetical protein